MGRQGKHTPVSTTSLQSTTYYDDALVYTPLTLHSSCDLGTEAALENELSKTLASPTFLQPPNFELLGKL